MIFINNKYTKTYYNIIERAQSRDPLPRSETEHHHILPRCLRPDLENLRLHPENGIHLTFREHFICHRLLTRMTEGNAKYKLLSAIWFMAQENSTAGHIPPAHIYESIRREYKANIGKSRKGKNNGMFGKNHTPETIELMKQNRPNSSGKNNSMFGKTHSTITKKKQSKARLGKSSWNKGITHTPETIEKIKQKHQERIESGWVNPCKGKPRWSDEQKKQIGEKSRNRKRVECEHCEKVIDISMHTRWHGDRCKLLNT